MGKTPKIILENPYRVLGVYANSPKKDIVANKGKAIAFLKVNKPVEYPLDLNGLLPPLSRSLNVINEAEAHLSIAKEQIKYAQFWFLNITPIDDIAFNRLLVGNMAEAEELWSKQESLSSLQNKLVCYLIEDKHRAAVMAAEKLYEKYGDVYIDKVDANSTLQMTGTDLLHLFLESLGDEIGYQKIIGEITSAEAKAYIRSQSIDPLIRRISSEVERTKRVDHKDPEARIEAARLLITNTEEPFRQLKGILPVTDSQYQMIADKLGLEILQCGIDYFLKTGNEDKYETTMKMLKYANSIVVGTIAKERCTDQIKELEKVIENLPPKEIREEDTKIKDLLVRYVKQSNGICNAQNLLNSAKPHLQSIKIKMGNTDPHYLKLSTIVVQTALHTVVEEVNAVQQGNVVELDNGLTIDLDEFMSPEDRQAKYNRIKSAVRHAWDATIIMDDFDLESDFRPHYNENRNTLKSMCNQMGIPTYVSKPTSSRPVSKPTQARPTTIYEGENREESNRDSLWEYMKSHKSSKWQAALITNILCALIGMLVYYNNNIIYSGEVWIYIGWGAVIGMVSWLCILYDREDKVFDGEWLAGCGCYGCVIGVFLIAFYWIYKIIRLAIDGIKGT